MSGGARSMGYRLLISVVRSPEWRQRWCLAEMGADVVLVEPVGGSNRRSLPGFVTWNRSKRSVSIDVDLPSESIGRQRLDELLARGRCVRPLIRSDPVEAAGTRRRIAGQPSPAPDRGLDSGMATSCSRRVRCYSNEPITSINT